MIEILEYEIGGKLLWRLLVINYFDKRWRLFALLTVAACGAMAVVRFTPLYEPRLVNMMIALTVLVLLAPMYIVFVFWRYVRNPRNRNYFKKRTMSIDDQYITTIMADGSSGTLKWKNVTRCKNRKTYFLIYVSKLQFYYLPKANFRADGVKQFEALLERNGIKSG